MELKEIQELIKMVKKADLCELKIKEGDYTLIIKNKGSEQATFIHSGSAGIQQQQIQSQPAQLNLDDTSGDQEGTKPEAKPAAPKNDNLFIFRSPMVGTFYRKPGADKDVFVKVGDAVKSGDVLCIIEAMKLFNEIEFDGVEGKIVKILVEDSSPVEYDQPLFQIEKNG
jgi:acetyl-CoA carboxylase biotin carboxyl carrier protein